MYCGVKFLSFLRVNAWFTLDDAPIFDPIVSIDSDYNHYDSQELVADYDDRPDAVYTSQSAPTFVRIISTLQQYDEDKIETEYNDSFQNIGELYGCELVHHSKELEPSQIEAQNDAEVTSNVLTITKKKRRGKKRLGYKERQRRMYNNNIEEIDGNGDESFPWPFMYHYMPNR